VTAEIDGDREEGDEAVVHRSSQARSTEKFSPAVEELKLDTGAAILSFSDPDAGDHIGADPHRRFRSPAASKFR